MVCKDIHAASHIHLISVRYSFSSHSFLCNFVLFTEIYGYLQSTFRERVKLGVPSYLPKIYYLLEFLLSLYVAYVKDRRLYTAPCTKT